VLGTAIRFRGQLLFFFLDKKTEVAIK